MRILAVDSGQAGPLGLLVLILLCVACYLLFKSMSKHLRRVREEWPEESERPAGPGTIPTASDAPGEDESTPAS